MNTNEIRQAQAAEWSVALSGDDVDQHVLARFEQWRSADPLNEEVFQSMDRVWRGMASMQNLR